jgi:DNA-binding winged helix-turn-helix (wHTH) protein
MPTEIFLADWRVQPSLNRLSCGAVTVRLEPKLMDVLLFLVQHAGTVVSKDEIADAVWPGAFLSESVITRAIAGLRKAFEDDAQAPRFIETIAKRGYRLLLPPVAPSDLAPPGFPTATPYSAGQWVRGERFHGRAAEIAEILDGPRNGIWLLGTRAIGKTSLLKELEHRTAKDPESRYFPLFWDLQGSDEPAELPGDFRAALAEAEDRLGALGLRLDDVAADDLFASLGRLRRALRAQGRVLLLLWDEAEELLALQARSPALLRRLRRALQSAEGIRTVMASGPRLWQLADLQGDTSPFLHGFAPPLPLGPLDAAAARGLVRPSSTSPEDVDEILRQSGGHPGLLQLLCARVQALGDVGRAVDSVAADPTVHRLFAVDFELLAPGERERRGVEIPLFGRWLRNPQNVQKE